jgi:hypothetical protein
MRKLTVADIVDMRAYERERAEFRQRIIELKKTRRIALGPILTVLFENTDTMRWQVQEMARAERMLRDEQIAHEVDTYNELIPDAGELSGTLFLELTSDEALREWLPKLVGIEFHVAFALPDGSLVFGKPSDADEERLTRDDVTAAVHYLRFAFSPEQVKAFETGPVTVIVDHAEYSDSTTLDEQQHASLAADLRDFT